MAKIISTIRATLTRIIFSVHSLIAVYTVYDLYAQNLTYAILCSPLIVLLLEGIFTLAIKKSQEWRWFCPSVFIYLSSVVPAIWLLELKMFENRTGNLTNASNFTNLTNSRNEVNKSLEDFFYILRFKIEKKTWITLIEQFLMLILIVGRWLLPKGDLTRDQLSQLLLVYIGTAADIIEFFESYKVGGTINETILVYLTLGIWSWSLLQFTIVLSATRARRSRGGGSHHIDDSTNCCDNCCCGIDVWGIVLNVLLQDAPFLAFRLLIIIKYQNINYMNIFFTCKNSLVIALQFYRLYAVNSEYWRAKKELRMRVRKNNYQRQCRPRKIEEDLDEEIYVISSKVQDLKKRNKRRRALSDEEADERKRKYKKKKKRTRKDTGYSTASSQNLYSTKLKDLKKDKKKSKSKTSRLNYDSEDEYKLKKKFKEEKSKKKKKQKERSSSESSQSSCYQVINEKKSKKKKRKVSSSSSSSDSSSSEDSSDTRS